MLFRSEVVSAEFFQGAGPAVSGPIEVAVGEPGRGQVGQCAAKITAMLPALQPGDTFLPHRDGLFDMAGGKMQISQMNHRARFAMPGAAAAISDARPHHPAQGCGQISCQLRRPGVRAAIPRVSFAMVVLAKQPIDAAKAGLVRRGITELGECRRQAQQ